MCPNFCMLYYLENIAFHSHFHKNEHYDSYFEQAWIHHLWNNFRLESFLVVSYNSHDSSRFLIQYVECKTCGHVRYKPRIGRGRNSLRRFYTNKLKLGRPILLLRQNNLVLGWLNSIDCTWNWNHKWVIYVLPLIGPTVPTKTHPSSFKPLYSGWIVFELINF